MSLFNDTLTLNAAKWLYDAGPECHKVLCSDEGTDNQEMFSRLVICYSALATWEGTCINMASSANFNGTTSALRIHTTGIKVYMILINMFHLHKNFLFNVYYFVLGHYKCCFKCLCVVSTFGRFEFDIGFRI